MGVLKRYLRRKFFVNPAFQNAFVLRMILINIFMCMLMYIGTYVIFYRFNILGERLGFSIDHEFYLFANNQFIYLTVYFLGIAISSSIIIAVYSIFLSHRIVGPLENIKAKFNEFQKREKAGSYQTSFRKDDFFHDFAESYNQFIRSVDKTELKIAPLKKEQDISSKDGQQQSE